MLITPVRPTAPKVGRNAVTPQRAAGEVMEPHVSEPIAKGTMPARENNFLVGALFTGGLKHKKEPRNQARKSNGQKLKFRIAQALN